MKTWECSECQGLPPCYATIKFTCFGGKEKWVISNSVEFITHNHDKIKSNIHSHIYRHVESQAKKRQLTETEILEECIRYHQEHAGT